MRGFLPALAASLYERYGDGVSSLNILMPSRRARLFFCDALSRVAVRPVWQPCFPAVDEMMQEAAGLSPADNIKLITELYKVYSLHHKENFDAFYFWGDMLLADFDAVDKYMIDAGMLFANVRDLRALEDDLSYLTPEQSEIIKKFWKNFGPDSAWSQEKEHFITIWRSLPAIYQGFRESLAVQGLGYTGMIHRAAAEKIRAGEAPHPDRLAGGGADAGGKRYVVAGFNALSECEKILFDHLRNSGSAEFYWDYDEYYVKNPDHEAGYFIRENLRRFPAPELYDGDHDNFVKPKEIMAVDAPSDSLQCKYVYTFLKSFIDRGETPGKETAIVLTDEALLQPVLYSIPKEIGAVNVTMGYPLKQTTAYSFVERLIGLQARSRERGGRTLFYHSDVEGILNHPYILETNSAVADDIVKNIRRLSQVYVRRDMLNVGGLIAQLFIPAGNWESLAGYIKNILSEVGSRGGTDDAVRRRAFFAVIIDNIVQAENSLRDCGVEVTRQVFASLLREILQNVRIPYEGEPLDGIQVMGILETRNLDFKNVLLLSINDDTFPGNRAADSSFIPYNLRVAYGLPTLQQHEAVYGYYFYRLLQRAEVVHLAYCSQSDDRRTGEPSRYIYQLLYESPHNVKRISVPLNINLSANEPIIVEKSGEIVRKLSEYRTGARALSPTSFYAYVECPLKFYFRNIEELRPEEEVGEEIDLPMFGTILHKAMETLYAGLRGVPDPRERIRELIGSPAVEDAVNRAINSEYLHDDSAAEEDYGGNILLVMDIVRKYINSCILPFDAGRKEAFTITELEKRVESRIGGAAFAGTADRIDILENGALRVVDYKTGGGRTEFADVESLFSGPRERRNPAALQTLLYAMMLHEAEKRAVQPALYYVRRMNDPAFSPLLVEGNTPITSLEPYYEPLKENLREFLDELFDTAHPFVQCGDKWVCEYCDYREICRR